MDHIVAFRGFKSALRLYHELAYYEHTDKHKYNMTRERERES